MADSAGSSSKAGRRDDSEEDRPAKRSLMEDCHCSSSTCSSCDLNFEGCGNLFCARISEGGSYSSHAGDRHDKGNAIARPKARSTEALSQIDKYLHDALSQGQLNFVEAIIKCGASVNAQEPKKGETPLTLICKQRPSSTERKSEQIEIIKKLLDNGALVNQKNFDGQTPLHLTCSASVAKLLLDKGATIDEVNRKGETPLVVACKLRRSVDLVTAFLEAGACVNGKNYKVPLYSASCAVTQVLLQNGANVDEVNDDGESALFANCRKPVCPTEVITKLLEHGASTNLKNNRGRTPLHVACQAGVSQTVELLIQKGASVNEVDPEGESPLFYASRKKANTDGVIHLLLTNGASINLKNSRGRTPLHVSCFSANFLLEYGASVNEVDNNCETPLFVACRGRSCPDNFVPALLRFGASLTVKNTDGDTPLHVACSSMDVNLVGLLLSYGAPVNKVNHEGETPLFRAVKRQRCPVMLIERLLEFGALINWKNSKDETPLHAACSKAAVNNVTILLDKGASIDEFDDKHASPLLVACKAMHSRYELASLLISRGASVNVQTTSGVTLLHLACVNPKNNFVDMLLSERAIVNGIDDNGNTPLLIACKKPWLHGIIKKLLMHGATVNKKNALGQTPLLVACCKKKCFEAVKILLEHGASVNEPDDEGHVPLEVVPPGDLCPLLLEYGATHCMSGGKNCFDQNCSFYNKHGFISRYINLSSAVLGPCSNLMEVRLLKDQPIGETNASYYDLLRLNIPRSLFEEVLTVITPPILEENCPLFANMLYRSYLNIKRLDLIEECCVFFKRSPLPALPPELVYTVFGYLDVADLTTLYQIMNGVQQH